MWKQSQRTIFVSRRALSFQGNPSSLQTELTGPTHIAVLQGTQFNFVWEIAGGVQYRKNYKEVVASPFPTRCNLSIAPREGLTSLQTKHKSFLGDLSLGSKTSARFAGIGSCVAVGYSTLRSSKLEGKLLLSKLSWHTFPGACPPPRTPLRTCSLSISGGELNGLLLVVRARN